MANNLNSLDEEDLAKEGWRFHADFSDTPIAMGQIRSLSHIYGITNALTTLKDFEVGTKELPSIGGTTIVRLFIRAKNGDRM